MEKKQRLVQLAMRVTDGKDKLMFEGAVMENGMFQRVVQEATLDAMVETGFGPYYLQTIPEGSRILVNLIIEPKSE